MSKTPLEKQKCLKNICSWIFIWIYICASANSLTDEAPVRAEHSKANKLEFKYVFQPAGFASEHQEETTGLGSLRNASAVCIGTPYCQTKQHIQVYRCVSVHGKF